MSVYMRQFNIRIDEHIGTSQLTKEEVKPKNNSVADQLLFRNHSTSYDDFSFPRRENNKFLRELKLSMLTMRDKPSLDRNMTLTIVSILQTLVTRSLLEFYLFLLAATLFLWNGFFII